MKPMNMGRSLTILKRRYPKYFETLNVYRVYYYTSFRCGMNFLRLPDGNFLYFTKNYQY